jgi:hypothetical protein
MRRLLLLIPVLWCSQALATISVDATSNSGSATLTGSSFTWNHAVGGGCSNSIIVIQLAGVINDPNALLITSVTYNSVAAKLAQRGRDHGGSEMAILQWILVAPTSGTHAIVATFSRALSGEYIQGSAVSFCGVHQSYPVRLPSFFHTGLTNSATLTATCSDAISGDYLVGLAQGHETTITQNGSQTAIFTSSAFGAGEATSWASAYIAAATRTTLIWTQTSGDGDASCISLRPTTDVPSVPAFDTFAQAVGTSVGTPFKVTMSNYVVSSGTNGLLLYLAIYDTAANTISSVTFGAANLTKLQTCSNASGNGAEIWYLKNPSASTANIVATFSGTMDNYVGMAETWFLVNQGSSGTTATGTFSTVASTSPASGTVTVSVPSTTTSMVVQDIASVFNFAFTAVPTGSEIESLSNGGGSGEDTEDSALSQFKLGTGGTVAMSWTNSDSSGFCQMAMGIIFGSPSAPTMMPSVY